MPNAQANGVRLYYEEHGEGSSILCIHGSSSSAMMWRAVAIEELSKLGRVIIYDRRGSTRSERPDPYETGVVQHAADAAELLDALDAAPAVVIGRSYGGDVALALTLSRPASVRALVLLEADAGALDPEHADYIRSLMDTIEAAAAIDPASVAETLLRDVVGDAQWEAFPSEFQQMFVDNSPAILAEVRGPALEATHEDLRRISVPTLIVTAEDSLESYRRVAARMEAAIPKSRTELVGGGHFVDPGEPVVLEFVRSILA